jgi:hypothetical protein
MAAPKIEREHIDKAREANSSVWQLWIDRKTKTPGGGSFGFSGVLPPQCEAQLMRMVRRWMKEGKV